VMAKV